MKQGLMGIGFALVAIGMLLVGYGPARADETGWSDTAEFSFVATSGNSESSTFGLKNTLVRAWEKSNFTLKAGGIRVETTSFTRFVEDDVVKEEKRTDTTAEAYYVNGRYDRNISERFFWYAGAGWDRNRFAGVDNRYVTEGGVGNTWYDKEDLKFKTNYGVTYTDQEDVVEDPTVDDSFIGVRFSWDYTNKFGSNTTYTNEFVLDENLDETEDWRADMNNGLAVAMSEKLALKLGLRLLYDNMPAIELVSVDSAGDPVTPVPFPLEELDTILTVSLVVNFK